MTNGEAVNWIINMSADIGKVEHRDLWHYEQALSEIRDMLETVQPEIMADGTLHVTVNADVANIDRILLSQEGTHYGDLYYKDDEDGKR